MRFKLLVVAGDSRLKEVEVETPATIGRSREADVTVGESLVSRKHCELTEDEEGLLIVEDLGSLNGTYVNETRLSEAVYLEPGDKLTVGSVTFQAVYGDFVPEVGELAEGAGEASDTEAADASEDEAEEVVELEPVSEEEEAVEPIAEAPVIEEAIEEASEEPIADAPIVVETDESASDSREETVTLEEVQKPKRAAPAAKARATKKEKAQQDDSDEEEGFDFDWLDEGQESAKQSPDGSDSQLGRFFDGLGDD